MWRLCSGHLGDAGPAAIVPRLKYCHCGHVYRCGINIPPSCPASVYNDESISSSIKLTNSGTDSVGLDPLSTLLTYTDTGNLITLTNSATSNGVGETSPWWYSEWKLSTGSALYSGEVVEITVGFFSTTNSGETVNNGGAIAPSDTTFTVTTGGTFTPNDIIYIEDEQMTVTNVAVDLLTVTRGDNGTSAVSHADGLTVFGLDATQSISVGINEPFKVELIPSQGAPFTITRTSPVEITAIMDLG